MEYIEKSIIVSVIIVLFAVLGYFFTPKKRSAFGYRTPTSLKNDRTWNYANNLAKKLFIWVTLIFITLEVVLYKRLEHIYAYKYSLLFLTIASVIVIPIIEIMLNLKFDKNGNIKN